MSTLYAVHKTPPQHLLLLESNFTVAIRLFCPGVPFSEETGSYDKLRLKDVNERLHKLFFFFTKNTKNAYILALRTKH